MQVRESLTSVLVHSYAKNLLKYIKKEKKNTINDQSYNVFIKERNFCCTKEEATYFEK